MKKWIMFLLLLFIVTLISTLIYTNSFDKREVIKPTYSIFLLGDVTGDGEIGINDVSRLYRYVKGIITLTDEEKNAGDVVADGSIGINDVSRLYRYTKGLVELVKINIPSIYVSDKIDSGKTHTTDFTIELKSNLSKIYYCEDSDNKCNPTNEYTKKLSYTSSTTKYLRYKVCDNSNNCSSIGSYKIVINNIVDSCVGTVASKELSGMHGVAMISKEIYTSSSMSTTSGNTIPGEIVSILGENGKKWAINYNGSCVWVDSTYMAINLKEYIPTITYNITNATSSIFKSSGKDIPGLTGEKLYTDEFKNFVPATYSFAIKLKKAQKEALANGDSIVVYEAYRPHSVTKYSSSKFINLLKSDSEVWKNVQYSTGASGATYSWGYNYFLAPSLSTHNTGCAADVSLKKVGGAEYEMPSAMHELSTAAIKYYSVSASHIEANYSVGMLANEGAKKLSNYMMNAGGLTDLASEWWHYQDYTCYNTIGTGVDFWSNVSN